MFSSKLSPYSHSNIDRHYSSSGQKSSLSSTPSCRLSLLNKVDEKVKSFPLIFRVLVTGVQCGFATPSVSPFGNLVFYLLPTYNANSVKKRIDNVINSKYERNSKLNSLVTLIKREQGV